MGQTRWRRRGGGAGSAPVALGLVSVALVTLALLLAGCGKKGDPSPPLRVIPNPTRDLAAFQRGDQLVLRFSYPQTTTSGAQLPGLSAVEVWELARPLADPANLPTVERPEFNAAARKLVTLAGAELQSAIEGGQVVLRPPLPPAPASGHELRVYGVRTVAEGGEASGWSNLVRLVPAPAPAPVAELAVEPRADGIEVAWQGDSAGGFQVYRRQAESRTWGEPLATLPTEARRHLDATARFGERYIYTVTALASREPRVESGFAAEREVDYTDRFAPAPPQDLEALPQSGGANLVWRPSPDADAVGYVIYRQDPGADFRRLNEQPVTELKYADSGLANGLAFRYRVTAVDAAGNEGPPTPEVVASTR